MGNYTGIVYDIDAGLGGTTVQVLVTDGQSNIVLTTDSPGFVGAFSAAFTTKTQIYVEYDSSAKAAHVRMRPVANNVSYLDHDGKKMTILVMDTNTGQMIQGTTVERLMQLVVETSIESGTPLSYVSVDSDGVLMRAKVNSSFPFAASLFENDPGSKN